MQDHLSLRNESAEPLSFELELEVDADFADIITVKEHDFSLGDPAARAVRSRRPRPSASTRTATSSSSRRTATAAARTQVILSERGTADGCAVRSRSSSRRGSAGSSGSTSSPSLIGEAEAPGAVERRFGAEREHVRDSLAAWRLSVPQLRTSYDDLRTRSPSRSPTSPRCGCAAATGSARCRPPGCRGS